MNAVRRKEWRQQVGKVLGIDRKHRTNRHPAVVMIAGQVKRS